MADDVRIVIDCDTHKVVVESAKAKRAIRDMANSLVTAGHATEQATNRSTRASDRWVRAQAAGAAAGRRQTQTLHELGRAARGATITLGALAASGLAHAAKTGIEFEKRMSAVNAVTNATARELEQLKKSAMDAGAATAFSAGEAAKAQEELAKGGLSVQQIIGGGLSSALSLAAAGELELADAAAYTVNAMKLFGMNGKDSAKVADALATAANKTTADVADFGIALRQGGAVAKSAGLTFTETVVILEALADAGVKNSDAGTSMKTALLQLLAPSKKQAELAKDLGLSFVDANGEMKSMSDISAMLRDKLGEQGKAQRTATLATLAGTDGVRTLTALYDAGPRKLEAYAKGLERTGSAAEVAKKKQDNVAGAFEQLTGSIETVEVALFSKFQEPLKDALLEATSVVNTQGKQVEEFFDRVFEMPEFKAADVGGKLRILLDEFDKTGLPDKMRDLIVEGFANGLNAALPIVIEGAAKLAVAGAKAFGKAFIEADPLSRVLLAGYLLHKTGALAAFRAYGKNAGAAVATGAAAGATGAAAAGGWKAGAKSMGKQFGVFAAVAAAAAYGPEFAKYVKEQSSGETADFKLPKNIGRGSITNTFGIAGAVQDFVLGKDKLKDFGDEAEKTFKKLKRAGDTRALAELADQTRDMAREFPHAGHVLNRFADTVDRAAGSASKQFAMVRESAGKNLYEIRFATHQAAFEIQQDFGPKTRKAKDALARNFLLAAKAIESSMRAGKISTKTGMAEIERMWVKALAQYGFTAKQARNIQATGDPDANKGREGGAPIARARGGLTTVGRKGARGRDNVPALLNGQPSVIAEGEQVAVFNRHQQAEMDARLADQGGLAGFFARNRKPHYMAAGGIAGYAPGGIVPIPGQPGEFIHRSILSDVLRIIRQYKARVTDGYAASGHSAAGEHPKGLAVDLVPGPGGSWEQITALANWAEPSQNNPRKPFRWVGYAGDANHGPGHHLHLSWLAGAGLGGAIGGVAALKRVLMGRRDLGAVSALGQRALDTTRAAAQARLDALAGSAGGAPDLHGSAAEASGDGAALMRQISERYGWNFGDWWEIDARETSHGRNLANPTSTARLRGQFLDMNWGKYGPGSDPRQNPSMAQQIESMAMYIKERYGNPTAALAHHNAHNWYAAGGVAPKGRRAPKPQNTRGTNRGPKATPKKNTARKFKPLKYRGKVLDAVPQLGRIASIDEQLERAQRKYDDMDRGFNLTDEEALITDAAGNEIRNEPGISQRVDEIDQLIGQKASIAKLLEDQRTAAQQAAKAVAEAVKERQERIADVLDAAKRNKRRIQDAQDDLNDERRGRGWQGKVAANDKRIDSLQDDLRAETSKKNGSRSLKLSLRNQIDDLQDENRRLKRTKPKGGDAGRVRRINAHLDQLRDEREDLVGTRSIAKDATADGGMLGSARKGLEAYREAQGGSDGRQGLVELLGRTLPDSMTDIGFDIAELRKEREKWTGTVAPAVDVPTPSGTDSGLADLLKAQLDSERERSRMLGQQFAVFSQFAPLVGARVEGHFLHGAARVPREMLAHLHGGETIVPDLAGPFRMTGRDMLGGDSQPVNVHLTFADNSGQLVRLVDARVDGRAAKVVSQELGRKMRLIASAPGGR